MLTTPSDSVSHDQELLSVIFSYFSFPKRSKLSCVNKDWRRASTNHRAVTINSEAFGMNMDNVLKFVGKSFNILENIMLMFAPYCTWFKRCYVYGPTLNILFEKRATVLRSVAIAVDGGTK